MTFQTQVWAVDGNAESSQYMLRAMLTAGTIGAQGVINPLDCIVQATGPATAGIQITQGGVVILGQEVYAQGSYVGWNVGLDTTLTIAATGGTARSDMVIARAEDPTFAGSSWGGPASGQIIFPRVLSNVGAGATTVPGGTSAIPLARIDMPPSTSVVQQSYINDLRTVCNPQQLDSLQTAAGPGSPSNWTTGTTNVQWPTGATWQVPVPSFATIAILNWACNQLPFVAAGNNWARGFVWPVIGSSVTAPTVTSTQTRVSVNNVAGRHTIGGGATVVIPASIRGTTQTVQFAQVADGTNTGVLAFDEGSSVWLSVEFWGRAATS